MSAQRRAATFRCIDLMLIVAIVGTLLMLAACGVGRVREEARRGQCQSNLRCIAISLYGMGSSPTGYPNASTAADRQGEREIGLPLVGAVTVDGQTYSAPGVADPQQGGYNWLVRILDCLEEVRLYEEIKDLSDNYAEPAFSPRMANDPSGGGMHFCRLPLPFLKCPTYAGGFYADEKTEIYTGIYAQPGISNYVCLPGTHFKSQNELVENGVIVSRAASASRLTLDDVTDGVSKTIILTETREPNYANWYDGQVNWVTPFLRKDATEFGADDNEMDADGIADVIVDNDWMHAINYGPFDANDKEYLYMTGFPYTKDLSFGGRQWGPSSMHENGITTHAFADGHIACISDSIDPAVYYALVTRAGSDDASIAAAIRE